MTDREKALEAILEQIWSELYGKNLQVSGWHLNGELEPLDSWFEENDWEIPNKTTSKDISSLVRKKHQLVDLKLTMKNAADKYMRNYPHLTNISSSEIRNIDEDIKKLNEKIGALCD